MAINPLMSKSKYVYCKTYIYYTKNVHYYDNDSLCPARYGLQKFELILSYHLFIACRIYFISYIGAVLYKIIFNKI